MTWVRRHWFSSTVLVLSLVIAFNLLSLSRGKTSARDPRNQAPSDEREVLGFPGQPGKKAPSENKLQANKKEAPEVKDADGKEHLHQGTMHCRGMMGIGMPGMRTGHMSDMMTIRHLLLSHKAIQRSVKQLPDGVETITTSADKMVADKIQIHVKAMYERLRKKQVIRPMDPLFAALFENADKIDAVVTDFPDGVRVKETSQDPYTVKLIRAHANTVDRFVREGMTAMPKMTPVPKD